MTFRNTSRFISILFVTCFIFSPSITFANAPFSHSFGLGSTDGTTAGEVTRLQRMLSQEKGIYPEGVVSGYFGKLTERGLQRWQAKNNIVKTGTAATTGYGWVGKMTRAALNLKIGTLPEMTGSLRVTASGDITSQFDLTKKSTYANKLSSSFIGTGNGQKVVFTQTSPNTKITTPATLSCVTPCSVENAVSIAPGTPGGAYQIKVTAVAGKESAITYYNVNVGAPQVFDFTLISSGSINAVKPLSGNASGRNTISVRAISGQVVPVTLTQTTDIKGLIVKNLGTCTPPCEVSNSVSMGADMATGNHSVTVRGTAGSSTRTVLYNISLATNGKFSYHISNQEDPDNSITMTRPASQSVTSYVPIKFILDSGEPRPFRLIMSKLPLGVSASISACTLPCEATLAITIAPDILIGGKSVSFSTEADYLDPTDGKMKVMKKSFTESVKVINGDQLTLPSY